MSNETNETISDIVAWLRRPREGENAYLTLWREEIADRIEASEKQSVTNCNRFGNAAKMREALESFNAVDLSGFKFPLDGDSSTIYNSNKKDITIPYWRVAELLNGVKAAQDMSKATLSAPPRNCDRPECATTKEAQDVWRKEDGGKTAYYEWILATSTKGESK